MKKTVADQFAEVLALAGVKRIYGVVGDSLNALTEALRKRGDIEWVAMRNEEAAAFAAGAEAHLTGRLAVCAGSCGPGNLHLINGLYDCHRSRVPVLAIAAQIPSVELGTGYFQETHPEVLFKECSHYCELVSAPHQMQRTAEIAVRNAVGKGGVAVVVLPGDVATQKTEEARAPTPESLRGTLSQVMPAPAQVEQMAALLNRGARVTLLCGAGCEGAGPQVVELARKLQAPVVSALRGKEYVEKENPHFVGLTGLIGYASGYWAMIDCDVLLMLGTDFPYRQFYPDSADTRIIQVDVRAENIGKRTRVDVGVVGSVSATVQALLPRIEAKRDTKHLERALAHYRKTRDELDALGVGTVGRKPIYPPQVARAFDLQASDDAIFTCDVGLPTVWAARYATMRGRRRLLGSFNHGSMASALAQAIGAQKAFPDRQVVAFSGDGGFTMLMGDFISLVQLGLPIKVVVFNNSSLGFVAMEQQVAGMLDVGTALRNPNFAALAEAVGIKGLRVEDPGSVDEAVQLALATPGPVLVDAVVSKAELVMPPKITASMAAGFTLFGIKALLNGRTTEVLELARTNLWR
ncbi:MULTISPECIES: ubiquinone-dependent pyruvate dehydrogenase [Corallococcus]|uniref:ubiquinone-dependent pyruvate dehydrogenase n=1 Tax=Corallococcus TaxID=83461 RepID=UPI00117C676A|nr:MULTISPECIES: ubiquinone-dependent pyruvate dehydrogenase [Corallococcus]NBD13817.1 ubiquinone-dependent pyruvate dehydrogenase [Corallococcus silvisoli]TSC22900.1 ubiquinone-dependent pyruvate dehydrogenase [Corallococcus sp. Z5C101001]